MAYEPQKYGIRTPQPLLLRVGVVFNLLKRDNTQGRQNANFQNSRELAILTIRFDTPLPKGPFRTKNTTMIAKMLNYYAVVFLPPAPPPPNLARRGPFFERKNVCNSQENGVRTRCAAIVNHPAVLKRPRVVNLPRVVFLVRRGSFGYREPPPPESKIELWVPKSTVDTQILENTGKSISTIAFAGSAKIWAPRWW